MELDGLETKPNWESSWKTSAQMFSISLLFPLNASEILSFEPWAAICHSRRISSGASKSRDWPEVPSDLEEPQIFLGFLIFTMGVFLSAFSLQRGSSRIPFFLTYWEEEGEREGGKCFNNCLIYSFSLSLFFSKKQANWNKCGPITVSFTRGHWYTGWQD